MPMQRYKPEQIVTMLRQASWSVGRGRVEQLWRQEGMKGPSKQWPRRCLWMSDGGCVRLRPEQTKQDWSYDFVSGRTCAGRLLHILTPIDECEREYLALMWRGESITGM